MLADLGADVIRIEDLEGGDWLREFGIDDDGRSPLFEWVNRGKRSVRLNLKSEGGRRAFLRLAGDADVVVEGFRPGVLERLDIGHEVLREANPRLILCRLSGYGQDGPYRDRAGHDLNYVSLSGIIANGVGDGHAPAIPVLQIADLAGGALPAVIAILAALYEVGRSGVGKQLDISMLDGAVALLAPDAGPDSPLDGRHPCYRFYRCADGWMSLGALEPKFWLAFLRHLGLEELADSAFAEGVEARHAAQRVEALLVTRTRDEWTREFQAVDACFEPVLSQSERQHHAQIAHRLQRSRPESRPAPAAGEHTREVLRETGMPDAEIDELIESAAAA
jgi:crotonobetainyl-CoA:carnitine CoA-transferase CaiB-like acyl-CoA transferase